MNAQFATRYAGVLENIFDVTEEVSVANSGGGSILVGALWMVVIPVLLFWLPGIGGLVGGVVGGKFSGSVGSALVAWLLSSILVGVLFAVLGTLISGFIVVGLLAGFGGWMLASINSGMCLIGAVIGGLLA
jgi:hypothetical protein